MDEQDEVARFRRDWTIDFGRNVICRKPRTILRRLKDLLYRTRYPVLALYRFARHHEATVVGIVYPDIVDRDMLPRIDEIPTRFVLNEPWTIPKQDLRTLYLGPLTQGTAVLVPPLPKRGFFITFWEIIKVLATLGGAIGFIVLVSKLVQRLF